MAEKNKGGRPKFKVTDKMKSDVELLSSFGIPQEQIAAKMGCSVDTLHKYFKDVMDSARVDNNLVVSQSLFNNAKKGNVVAQMFWLKTQARWKETSQLELTGKDDGPVEISEAKSRLLAGLSLPEPK